MKEFKGTKGKWKIFDRSSFLVVSDQNKVIVNTAISSSNTRQEELDAESMANAQLIASAPELLEALQNTLSILKSMIGTTHGDWIQVQEAERVVNKALGTSAGA